jgi:glycosyltransferase involved in cell wall biosynthesis
VSAVGRHLERIVVVDDGSRDGTGSAAAAEGAEVVRLPENLGKGLALRTGIAAALASQTAAVVLLDADGQHDPDDLPALLAAWDDGRPDLVIGARLGDRASMPSARYWTNYIGTRVLSWMTGRELEDSQCGYRLLSASLAERLDLRSDGFAIESEMLIKASRQGARFAHVPVRTIYNGSSSHFRPVLDTLRISLASVYFQVFDDR